MSNYVQLFTYRDAMNKEKHMAIFEDSADKAKRQFFTECAPTDRLVTERTLTIQQYREWKRER